MSGTVTWKQTEPSREEPVGYVPSNNVQGFGRLRGRKVVFTADDFSIRAGHADGALMEKTVCWAVARAGESADEGADLYGEARHSAQTAHGKAR